MERPPYSFLVTARHVIEGIRSKGVAVLARFNNKSGGADWHSTREWYFPEDPSLDVAISQAAPIDPMDQRFLHRSVALTPLGSQNLDIGVGDELFITGLFASHTGNLKNVPIVRVGNLATYPEERVRTDTYGEIDAYLIEVRSIGGLSGSPVFLYVEPNRSATLRRFSAPISPIPTPRPWTEEEIRANNERRFPKFYLFGLIHGHYVRNMEPKSPVAESVEALNTGIAIVVPVQKILDFIDAKRSSLEWGQ